MKWSSHKIKKKEKKEEIFEISDKKEWSSIKQRDQLRGLPAAIYVPSHSIYAAGLKKLSLAKIIFLFHIFTMLYLTLKPLGISLNNQSSFLPKLITIR